MKEEGISLNSDQLAAVHHDSGPLLVIAGAGTGKTRVITEKIRFLILEKGLKPDEILALTFTEKAAKEMEERVDLVLPLGAYDTWIMTFHSFGERVLRENSYLVNLDPSYQLMTEAQSMLLLNQLLPDLALRFLCPLNNPTKNVAGILTHLNRLRDEDISPEEYQQYVATRNFGENEAGDIYKELSSVYSAYQAQKWEKNQLDFADLISLTLKLFREHPQILRSFQKRFKAVVVDEFQDTNYSQSQLLYLVAPAGSNLMVVGDDDQSIFRWRGAAVYNVLDFEKHYKGAKTVTLKRNYRSSQAILDGAYRLIQHNNPHRLEARLKVDKKLYAQRRLPPHLQLFLADREEEEVMLVVDEINDLVANGKYNYKDIAILVRANSHGDVLAQALRLKGVPVLRSREGFFYQNSLVKDLLSFLHALADPYNDSALFRILSLPSWHIPGSELAILLHLAHKHNRPLSRALEIPEVRREISENTFSLIEKVLLSIKEKADRPGRGVGEVLYDFIEESELIHKLKSTERTQGWEDVTSVSRLFQEISRFDQLSTNHSVHDFLQYLPLIASPESSSSPEQMGEGISLFTIHGAKGLEFPVVFMVNLVRGRFPTIRRQDQFPMPEGLIKEAMPEGDMHEMEERRLFYVGMTRAEERLYLSAAKYYGEGKSERKISPFVYEALGNDLSPYVVHSTHREATLFDYDTSRRTLVSEKSNTNYVPNNTVEYLSYSSLDSFLICPLQYKYRYVLSLPEKPSAPSTYGTTLHAVMKGFYEALKQGRHWGLPEVVAYYHSLWSSVGFKDLRIEEMRKREGEIALTQYFEKWHDPKRLPKYLEKPFKIKLGKVYLSGVIDRVDVGDDGNVEIIDYKTSKLLTESQLKSDRQLSLYALAATSKDFLNLPLQKLTLSLYNFQESTKQSTTRKAEDLVEIKRFVLEKAMEIEKSDFSPKVSPMCEYCSFQLICDAYQGSLRGL